MLDTWSVISVFYTMLDKVSYLSFAGKVGQGQLSQFSRQIMEKSRYLSCQSIIG